MLSNEIILNSLPFSVYWVSAKDRTFKGCNKYFLVFLKFDSLQKIVGKSIDKFLESDYLSVVADLLEKSIKNQGKTISAFYSKKNEGEEIIFMQSVYLMEKELVVFSEISKIQEFNRYLWEEKEKLDIYLNNIVENVPASFYWKDRNHIILGGSKLHAQLAGYTSPKQVIGKTENDFVWKEQARQIQENDCFVMENNQLLMFEEAAILRDGTTHTFLTRKSPLKDKQGGIIGVLGVSLDITDLKEAHKALAKAKIAAEAAN